MVFKPAFGSDDSRTMIVMAGLVPAIHVLPFKKDVDARHKARHDEDWGRSSQLN
jgi:hypothetical protein